MSAVGVKSFAAPPLDEREVYRYARCPKPTEREAALLAAVRAEVEHKLTYRVCRREVRVSVTEDTCTLGGVSVRSKSLASALAGCETAVVFAATIGLELDRLLVKYNRLDAAKALFLQALGAERVEGKRRHLVSVLAERTDALADVEHAFDDPTPTTTGNTSA